MAEPNSVAVASLALASTRSDGLGASGAVNLSVPTDAQAGFSFVVPCQLVSRCDANERPMFLASSDDGGTLPDWLIFDPYTATFTGKAPRQLTQLSVQVSTVGAAGNSAWTRLQLNFARSSSKP